MPPTFRIGDVTITPILDGVLALDPREAAPGIGPETIAAEAPGLVDAGGLVRLPVICHLVRTARHLVLVDSGIGSRPRPGWDRGRLDAALRELGVEPGDIDLVVNTHMHADHVGWNTIDEGRGSAQPFFPNARHLFQALEWAHWVRPDRLEAPGNEYLAECVTSLAQRVELELVDGDVAIAPELSYVSTPGHTPGHAAIGVSSGDERALIVGDATHYPAQLDHPDWSPLWDLDPTTAAHTRARLFDSLEGDPVASIVTTHWPYPGIGRVVRTRGRRFFRAVAPEPAAGSSAT